LVWLITRANQSILYGKSREMSKHWNDFKLPNNVPSQQLLEPVPMEHPNSPNHFTNLASSAVSRSNAEEPVYDMIHNILEVLTKNLVITFDDKSYGLYEMHKPTAKGGRTRKHHSKKRRTRKH
jgi:hypothetical protein